MNDGVFLDSLDEQMESLRTFKQILSRAAAGDVIEGNAKKIFRKRKDLNGIKALAISMVVKGNVSKVPWRAGLHCLETAIRELRFQETWEFLQGFAPETFRW